MLRSKNRKSYIFFLSEINCGNPGTPSNGQRHGSDFSFGATVRFTCNHGYELNGENSIKCEATGDWSHPTPKCDCK